MFKIGTRVRVIQDGGPRAGELATVTHIRGELVPGAPTIGIVPDNHWFGGPGTVHYVHAEILEKVSND